MAGEFDEIRGRLEGIAEELADLAIVRLRESIARVEPSTRSTKTAHSGRRAVEKAIHLLEEPDDSTW